MKEIRPFSTKDEHRSKLLRAIKGEVHKREAIRQIIRAIPDELAEQVKHIDTEGHHLFGGGVTLVFQELYRRDAIRWLGILQPVTLAQFVTDNRSSNPRRQIRAATSERPGEIVLNRITVAPFLFTVKQGLNFGPLVMLTWLHRVGDVYVTVEFDIGADPARFTLESKDAKLPIMLKWRWERTKAFPIGHVFGSWNHWMPERGVDNATCTVFWPLTICPTHLIHDPVKLAQSLLLGETEGEP